MKTKYNIGDKVLVKAVVIGIAQYKTDKEPKYTLNVYDGDAGWGSCRRVCADKIIEILEQHKESEEQ